MDLILTSENSSLSFFSTPTPNCALEAFDLARHVKQSYNWHLGKKGQLSSAVKCLQIKRQGGSFAVLGGFFSKTKNVF